MENLVIDSSNSLATIMLGNVRPDKATGKIVPVSIVHGSKVPLYNLSLSRTEKLGDWLDSCDVNFMGSIIPFVFPLGVNLVGLPSIPNPFTLELPALGLPSLPVPVFSFGSVLDNLQRLNKFGAEAESAEISSAAQQATRELIKDLTAKIKKAAPDLSKSVPVEWFVNLLVKINPLELTQFLTKIQSIPLPVWPEITKLSLLDLSQVKIPDLAQYLSAQLPNLSKLPNLDLAALTDAVRILKEAFTDATGHINDTFSILVNWLAALKDKLPQLTTAMLGEISLPISFSFPGLPYVSVPPAGTPWPTAPTVIPPISWPDWMKPPGFSSIPLPTPPNVAPLATAPAGVFAFQSLPGNFYQTFFAVNIKKGLAPGLYTQDFYVQGTPSLAGAPLQTLAKITAVCQVLEDTLSPGIRPFGAVTY